MILCMLVSTCHVALAALHLRGKPLYIGVHLVSSVFFILPSMFGRAMYFMKSVDYIEEFADPSGEFHLQGLPDATVPFIKWSYIFLWLLSAFRFTPLFVKASYDDILLAQIILILVMSIGVMQGSAVLIYNHVSKGINASLQFVAECIANAQADGQLAKFRTKQKTLLDLKLQVKKKFRNEQFGLRGFEDLVYLIMVFWPWLRVKMP